jgi:hypothetical protein
MYIDDVSGVGCNADRLFITLFFSFCGNYWNRTRNFLNTSLILNTITYCQKIAEYKIIGSDIVTFKWISTKQDERVLTGFIWLK